MLFLDMRTSASLGTIKRIWQLWMTEKKIDRYIFVGINLYGNRNFLYNYINLEVFPFSKYQCINYN